MAGGAIGPRLRRYACPAGQGAGAAHLPAESGKDKRIISLPPLFYARNAL